MIRLISCILVVAMILQLTPVQNVRAAYTDDEVYKLLKEALKDAAEEDKEEIEEAIWDSNSTKKAGDWYQACINPKGDNLPWNYFHNMVQKYIVNLDIGIGKEETIVYTEEQKKKDDGPVRDTGSADLYLKDNRTNKTYLWEIKPGSYVLEKKENRLKGSSEIMLNQIKNMK